MPVVKIILSKIRELRDPVGECRRLGATIGEDCVIKPSMMGSEPWLITLGNHVLVAEGTQLLTHNGAGWCLRQNIDDKIRMEQWGKINIGNNVYIGINSIIMPGVDITDNVIIGAGTIVAKSITEDGVYIGAPAHRIKTFQEWKEQEIKKTHNLYGMSFKQRKEYFDRIL